MPRSCGCAESHFADAASHARLALSGFAAAGREGDRIEAAAVLTRALIAQGSIAEAFRGHGAGSTSGRKETSGGERAPISDCAVLRSGAHGTA